MGLGFAQTEVAFLAVLHVGPQLLTQGGPQVGHGVHGQGELPYVAGGLAHPAGVAAGAAVADLLFL